MPTQDAATERAEAIASQGVDLKDTEVLVLRVPPEMSTMGQVFKEFRRELRALLPEDAGTIRAIVLRSDMELDSYTAEELARVGLASIDAQGAEPEKLFDDPALQAAARAGWQAALGQNTMSSKHVAEESMRLVKAEARLQIEYRYESVCPEPLGRGFLYGYGDVS